MKKDTIITAVLWIAALGVVAYLFQGQGNTAIAIILIAILAAVDLGSMVYKK